MLKEQLLRGLQEALKKKNVNAEVRGGTEILVPMEFMPLVYGELQTFEEKAKTRKASIKKTIEMLGGKEYEVIEVVM